MLNTARWMYIRERGLRTVGLFYACDLAGFIFNSVKKNAASIISVRQEEISALSVSAVLPNLQMNLPIEIIAGENSDKVEPF